MSRRSLGMSIPKPLCTRPLYAGDIGGASVLAALRPAGTVVAVCGNNDSPAKWAEDERHSLEQLPLEAALELPGGPLVVVHGDRVLPPASGTSAYAVTTPKPER
jgi:predicted phosphodiesterase